MIRPVELASIDIWLGLGKGRHFHSPSSQLETLLNVAMTEATDISRERRANKTRKALILGLQSTGLPSMSQTKIVDRVDAIGLIGEIIAEDFAMARKQDVLWAKWRVGGTSKSRGIDLVTKSHGSSTADLRLVESKHLHDEIKGKGSTASTGSIKTKLNDGLEEFDQDKTRLNLAGVLRKMSTLIRQLSAAKSNSNTIQQSRNFVDSKLRQNEYACEVVASLDSNYCTKSTLSTSIKDLQLPSSIGRHAITLIILACDSLEAVTDKIC